MKSKLLPDNRLMLIIVSYLVWVLVFVLQKPVFMLANLASYDSVTWKDMLSVMMHGLPLDFSIAAYLTIIPTLLLIASCWSSHWMLRRMAEVYFALVSFMLSVIFIANAALYPFWHFPLDATPIFYFLTSPSAAMASVGWQYKVTGLLLVLLYACLLYVVFRKVFVLVLTRFQPKHGIRQTVGLLLFLVFLIIPIRGGFSVAAMNTGQVFFSTQMAYNHAAVNPAFSLMESLTHSQNFAEQYRFMEEGRAQTLLKDLLDSQVKDNTDDMMLSDTLFNVSRPNVLFIILESFSSHLFPTLGGEPVAGHMDKMMKEGVVFTRFYANSFRTDRGLVSILSGYPAQPTMSLMKYPAKTRNIPSIAHSLKQAGYGTAYYYGGDADFTNMRSYLFASGFEKVVEDKDFPVGERLSKWGVHDHLLFERLLSDLKNEKNNRPMFRVLQTSSSHEPFQVPYHRYKDERKNAFAYTDSVVGAFVRELKQLPQWHNTVVVLVPDHQGGYPHPLENYSLERFQIPLLIIGGAVKEFKKIDVVGAQQDIAATLLAQLRLPHKHFTFSKNMLNAASPHFAFFTMPDVFGFVTQQGAIIFDNQSRRILYQVGTENADKMKSYGQAYLQSLYNDIAGK